MNSWIYIFAATSSAVVLCASQQGALNRTRQASALAAEKLSAENARLLELRQRNQELDQFLQDTKAKIKDLRQEVAAAPANTAPAVIPPDPQHHGGWPAQAAYFYLPKSILRAVDYPLFASHRLTDEAATLFCLTPAQREAVDAAYNNLRQKFRDLEMQRMERVDTPENDRRMMDNRDGISYRIPSLAAEARELLAEFSATMQNTLGAARTDYLMKPALAYFQDQLQDLGETARVITFWPASADGKQAPFFGVLEEGKYSSVSMVQDPVEPDSATAYYARLFGVDIPIKE